MVPERDKEPTGYMKAAESEGRLNAVLAWHSRHERRHEKGRGR